MNILAAMKLQKLLSQITPGARQKILREMLPVLSRNLPPALVRDAIEAVRDVLA